RQRWSCAPGIVSNVVLPDALRAASGMITLEPAREINDCSVGGLARMCQLHRDVRKPCPDVAGRIVRVSLLGSLDACRIEAAEDVKAALNGKPLCFEEGFGGVGSVRAPRQGRPVSQAQERRD